MMPYLQAKVFAIVFLWTLAALSIFDFFEAFRKRCHFRLIANLLGDIIFFSVAGVLLLLLIIIVNSGMMRGYILLSLCAGSIVYVTVLHSKIWWLCTKWWNGIFALFLLPKKVISRQKSKIY